MVIGCFTSIYCNLTSKFVLLHTNALSSSRYHHLKSRYSIVDRVIPNPFEWFYVLLASSCLCMYLLCEILSIIVKSTLIEKVHSKMGCLK